MSDKTRLTSFLRPTPDYSLLLLMCFFVSSVHVGSSVRPPFDSRLQGILLRCLLGIGKVILYWSRESAHHGFTHDVLLSRLNSIWCSLICFSLQMNRQNMHAHNAV